MRVSPSLSPHSFIPTDTGAEKEIDILYLLAFSK
jgi:hypothetical protein